MLFERRAPRVPELFQIHDCRAKNDLHKCDKIAFFLYSLKSILITFVSSSRGEYAFIINLKPIYIIVHQYFKKYLLFILYVKFIILYFHYKFYTYTQSRIAVTDKFPFSASSLTKSVLKDKI